MRIIINENQEQVLLLHALMEEYNFIDTQKDVVKRWLKQHFKPMDYEDTDEQGYPIRKSGLCLLDSNGMPSQTLLTWEDGLDRLESQFKKISTDKTQRRKLLNTILKDWWNGN